MACTYILDGKELTYEEFAQKLQEGLMKEVLDAVTKMENEERLVGLSKASRSALSISGDCNANVNDWKVFLGQARS